MAIKKATRLGQTVRIPLLSDPDYQAARLVALDAGADREAIEASELRFGETLDASLLIVQAPDVTHATIRSIGGADFADADDDAVSAKHFGAARAVGIISRALVSVDGFEDIRPVGGRYPVEQLATLVGPVWASLRVELVARIDAWCRLGESGASPSAPSSGEAT
jgi:hypothetical protein